MPAMTPDPITRLRKICLSLPEAREVEAWGAPTFRVKTIFAMYSGADDRDDRESAWIKAAATDQEFYVSSNPDRFFVPPYVGTRGWIGMYIDDADTDWDLLAQLLLDAWTMSAPKRLVAAYQAQRDQG